MFRCSRPGTFRIRQASRSLLVLLALAVGPVAAEEPGYVVGPQDVLTITVYDQPHLSGKFAVEADGTFTFPLLGRVRAGGLTLSGVETEVRDRLARGYLKNPQVSVAVDQYRSQQVFVMGEVRQPGSLLLTGPMTLIEALARTGSVTDRAGSEAVIVRPIPGNEPSDAGNGPAPAGEERTPEAPGSGSEVIRVSLRDLEAGALSLNVALRAGDTIFVPRAETAFVLGQVKSPGEYTIRKGATVMRVLALAGGVTDRGSTRRIQIIRAVRGTEITLSAGLHDPVQAGDTILVRERFF